jgi:hypothetical protein
MTHALGMMSFNGVLGEPEIYFFPKLIGGKWLVYFSPFQQNIISQIFDFNKWWTFHEDIHFKTIKKHPNYIIIIVLHIPHVDFVKVHNTPHG